MPKKKKNLSTCYKCQTQLSNCWIRDFESFDKKNKNVKPICKTVEVAIIVYIVIVMLCIYIGVFNVF